MTISVAPMPIRSPPNLLKTVSANSQNYFKNCTLEWLELKQCTDEHTITDQILNRQCKWSIVGVAIFYTKIAYFFYLAFCTSHSSVRDYMFKIRTNNSLLIFIYAKERLIVAWYCVYIFFKADIYIYLEMFSTFFEYKI